MRMFSFSPLTTALSPVREREEPTAATIQQSARRRLDARWVFAVAASAVIGLLVLNVWFRTEYGGDEGFYTVTALNMLESPNYLLRPSNYPLGDFGADKEAFAHPPFNSYAYAIALWFSRGSLFGAELVCVLFYALLLLFAYRTMRLFQTQIAVFAVLLLAASPAILRAYAQLEAEPMMVTFGIMGLYGALRRRFFLSGLCVGMSFASKLWLCGPLALAVLVAIILRGFDWRHLLRFAGGVALPSAAHLVAVACFYPEDLGFWLKQIYFGIFTSSGISGGKISAAAVPASWVHPWWYYPAAIYRDHYFLAPCIILGLRSLLRDERLNLGLLWIIAAGVAGIAPLSLMKVKEPMYILGCVIFLYFLAGACVAALARRIAAGEGIDSFSRRWGTLSVLGLLMVFPLAYMRGIQPEEITRSFVIVHTLALGIFLGVFWWSQRKDGWVFDRAVFAACAIAVVAGIAYGALTREPRDKVIAQVIEPYLGEQHPNKLSLVASNYKSYQLYNFRRGCYWQELPPSKSPSAVLMSEEFAGLRAFIIDADDQELPTMGAWLDWLTRNASEKTAEVNGRIGSATGFRVFVR